MKKKLTIPMMGIMVLLSACQKNPDSSIVKNKDLDNMIEQAGDNKNGSTDVAKLTGEWQEYKTELKDESLHVTVHVDAKVEVPSSDKMSVFRVKQRKVDQNLMDLVKKELVKDTTLYDGGVLSMQTRSAIEQEIQMEKEEMARIKADTENYDKKSRQVMVEECQERINRLKQDYEKAPNSIELANYPFDGKLSSVDSLCKKYPNHPFYTWEKELNKEGDLYYGVSDGKNGQYIALYAQNNEDYGNCIRYASDRTDYVKLSSVIASNECDIGRWKIADGISEENLIVETDPSQLIESKDSSATLTQQEAQEKAESLLNALGIKEFKYESGDLYGEITKEEPDENGKYSYRKVYILKYMRNIDGVFVDNENGSKLTDGWQDGEYVKREWDGEKIEVLINDDGIVGFYYSVPMEVVETVVDRSSMKKFDEIKSIFEQMIVVSNAKQDDEERVTIEVNRVVLRYTRISEKDSYDTGLLVPVWDFMGKVTQNYGEKAENKETCVMTINAIDGSVIDRRLGY